MEASLLWEMWHTLCVDNECESKRNPEVEESTFPGALRDTCRSQTLLLGGASSSQVQGKQSPALLRLTF